MSSSVSSFDSSIEDHWASSIDEIGDELAELKLQAAKACGAATAPPAADSPAGNKAKTVVATALGAPKSTAAHGLVATSVPSPESKTLTAATPTTRPPLLAPRLSTSTSASGKLPASAADKDKARETSDVVVSSIVDTPSSAAVNGRPLPSTANKAQIPENNAMLRPSTINKPATSAPAEGNIRSTRIDKPAMMRMLAASGMKGFPPLPEPRAPGQQAVATIAPQQLHQSTQQRRQYRPWMKQSARPTARPTPRKRPPSPPPGATPEELNYVPIDPEVHAAFGWGAAVHEKPVMTAYPPLPRDYVIPSNLTKASLLDAQNQKKSRDTVPTNATKSSAPSAPKKQTADIDKPKNIHQRRHVSPEQNETIRGWINSVEAAVSPEMGKIHEIVRGAVTALNQYADGIIKKAHHPDGNKGDDEEKGSPGGNFWEAFTS
ncbi:hypothetical protein DFJ77DRAFT_524603 [Powellomyces hirtus]|nr:hypothetical protein DFJ77DRAFT_524603 [Powellomyces hirtus]